MSTDQPDQPDQPDRRAETERVPTAVDHLGKPCEFIDAEDEEARKMWDARLWKPTQEGGI